MSDWRLQAEELRKSEGPEIGSFEYSILSNHYLHGRGINLLRTFTELHPSPIDIAIILHGALYYTKVLVPYVKGNNLLFFRPKTSHRSDVESSFLDGEVYPDRTLLLFDSDILTGNAMTETRDYFLGLGYSEESIYGYIDIGPKGLGNFCQLMHINDLLQVHKIVSNSGGLK